jgi:hypothetical protein
VRRIESCIAGPRTARLAAIRRMLPDFEIEPGASCDGEHDQAEHCHCQRDDKENRVTAFSIVERPYHDRPLTENCERKHYCEPLDE